MPISIARPRVLTSIHRRELSVRESVAAHHEPLTAAPVPRVTLAD
jgi:hypothetical protein